MNLVRLGMIIALGAVAIYALSIYAAIPVTILERGPKEYTSYAPVTVSVNGVTVTGEKGDLPTLKMRTSCPDPVTTWDGVGAVVVACMAITGALSVSAVDLWRRVY